MYAVYYTNYVRTIQVAVLKGKGDTAFYRDKALKKTQAVFSKVMAEE